MLERVGHPKRSKHARLGIAHERPRVPKAANASKQARGRRGVRLSRGDVQRAPGGETVAFTVHRVALCPEVTVDSVAITIE